MTILLKIFCNPPKSTITANSKRFMEKPGVKPPLVRVLQIYLGDSYPDILGQSCTQDFRVLLMHIAKNTTLSQHFLGRSLDLSEPEIRAILHEHPIDLTEQKYQVLLKWINKTGPEATYLRLITALYSNDDLPTVQTACQMIAPDKAAAVRDMPSHPSSLHFKATTPLLSHPPPDRSWTDSPFSSLSTPHQDHDGPVPGDLIRYLTTPHLPLMGTMGCRLESPSTALTSMASLPEKHSVPGRSPSGEPESLASRSETSHCSKCDSPEHAHQPRCKHPIGHQLQHNLENLVSTRSERVAELQAEKDSLQIQLEKVASGTTELHKKNEVLKSQLAIAEDTVTLIWDALEKCKTQADLVPVQEQYRELESNCANAETPDGVESLQCLKSQLESLQQEKEGLDSRLGSLASVHQETLRQLKTFQVEAAAEGDCSQKQVDNSRKEMDNLMGNLMSQIEKLKFEKQDLEDRYKDLEERNRSQENKISYLQTENERLRQNRPRGISDTGVHRPHHVFHMQRCASEPGAYDSRHHCTEIRKGCSQDGNASTTKTEASTSTCTSAADTSLSQRTAPVPDEKVSICRSWIQNISEVVVNCETQSQKLNSHAQDLSGKLKLYSERCRKRK